MIVIWEDKSLQQKRKQAKAISQTAQTDIPLAGHMIYLAIQLLANKRNQAALIIIRTKEK